MRDIDKLMRSVALLLLICGTIVLGDFGLPQPDHGMEPKNEVVTIRVSAFPVSNVSAQSVSYRYDGKIFKLSNEK